MSLFPRDIDNDPFFSGTGFPPPMFPRDPFQNMFGGPSQRYGALTDGRAGVTQIPRQRGVEQHAGQQLVLRDPFQSMMFPFGGMSPFGSMFQNMERMMQAAANDPNAHTFSSSSVMHYSSSGAEGGQPKVYHASSSTQQAPGGVRETRKAVHDSESGTRKMAIGHHIGDRSHVIEKRHNTKTQEKEELQEFVNIDEDDARSFDHEWKDKTSRYHPSLQAGRHHGSLQRCLPAPSSSSAPPSETRQHHAGEKRKHRPPSLVCEGDSDDVTIVGHHYPTSAAGAPGPSYSSSRPKAAATPHERRDIGGRQLHVHAGEGLTGHRAHQPHAHQHNRRNFEPSDGLRSDTTNDHSQRHQQTHFPETYHLSSRPTRHQEEEAYPARETHHHGMSHRLDPGSDVRGQQQVNSNKRHKQNVRFQ